MAIWFETCADWLVVTDICSTAELRFSAEYFTLLRTCATSSRILSNAIASLPSSSLDLMLFSCLEKSPSERRLITIIIVPKGLVIWFTATTIPAKIIAKRTRETVIMIVRALLTGSISSDSYAIVAINHLVPITGQLIQSISSPLSSSKRVKAALLARILLLISWYERSLSSLILPFRILLESGLYR